MKKYIKPIAEAITVETNAQTMIAGSYDQAPTRKKGVEFVDYDEED